MLSRRTIQWLIPTLLTIHNVEEAIAFRVMRPRLASSLPGWLGEIESRLSTDRLMLALAILSILAFALAAVIELRPRSRAALWLLLALEAAVGINALSHVVTSLVVFRGYGPGLVTALLINAPFAVYVLRRARDETWVDPREWPLLLLGGLILHGPVLLGGLWLAAR